MSERRPCALTIGNFDGVHAGHRKIFERVRETALANGWIPAVLTFDPHPARVLAPDRAPQLLSTLEERKSLMRAAGIEEIFVVPFDREFSLLAPREFFAEILVRRLNAKAVLVGDNFRFGHKQAGDTAALLALGREFGVIVEIVGGVRRRGRMVSSSEIRRLIREGNAALAARLMTRPYAVAGEVVRGQGVGSKQTVPTLNLSTAAEILPRNGVYLTCTRDLDGARQWRSITNIGNRPTFGGETQTIETFLLDPFDGGTPKRIRVEFLRRVRDERKFESPEALREQILRDAEFAKRWFRRVGRLKPVLY